MYNEDIGQFVMKLWDAVISDIKTRLTDEKTEFLRDLPRRIGSSTSVAPTQNESYVRELSEKLIKINQELLNDYAVKNAKKVRANVNKLVKTNQERVSSTKDQLKQKEAKINGLKAKNENLEDKIKVLQSEKNEALERYSDLVKSYNQAQDKLSTMEQEYERKIQEIEQRWKRKLEKVQEDWESYSKLKVAEIAMEKAKKPEQE